MTDNSSMTDNSLLWQHRGQRRPAFAIEPKADQESVWDYPRPPSLVADYRPVRVQAKDGTVLIEAQQTLRLLETASPPTFYLNPSDLTQPLELVAGESFCEWKGKAEYLGFANAMVGWRYPNPREQYAALAGWIAFYPANVDCFVAGKLVLPQAGNFYGGWVTDEIVGPFKGEPGTGGW